MAEAQSSGGAPPRPAAKKGAGVLTRMARFAEDLLDGAFGGAPEPEPAEAPAEAYASPPLGGGDDDAVATHFELAVEADEAEEAEAPQRETIEPLTRRVEARVVLLADGKLVLSFVADGRSVHHGARVRILVDGVEHEVAVLDGSIRDGTPAQGTAVRLVLAWSGARPTQVHLPGLVLEVR